MATRYSKRNSSVRAVLCLRMSSGKQEKSIPAQRDEGLAYCQREGYKVVGEYVDEAVSGDRTEKRKDFLRLREDAGKDLFDVVVAWDQDRFSRNDPFELGYWVQPLRQAGIGLEFVDLGAASKKLIEQYVVQSIAGQL